MFASHTFCNKLQLQTQEALLLSIQRTSKAGEMPKQCLFLGSSNPCWKSSNDSLQLCRSQYISAQTEGRCVSVTPALYFKAKVKFVAFAVAGNGSAFISHLSAQPTTCSLFDLQLWSPSKKASKCR